MRFRVLEYVGVLVNGRLHNMRQLGSSGINASNLYYVTRVVLCMEVLK